MQQDLLPVLTTEVAVKVVMDFLLVSVELQLFMLVEGVQDSMDHIHQNLEYLVVLAVVVLEV
jgi:hypothetical protein